MEFVHLHTHSHYSLLDGLAKIDQLVDKAKRLGMPALAITDHGVLYGAVEFYQACTAAGIKPIIGVETYLAPRTRHDRDAKVDERPYHLTLLAKTTEGYHNLVRLVSAAQLEGFYYKPRVDEELLRKYGRGIIALSGCLNGLVSRRILSGDLAGAEAGVLWFKELFPDGFYLEIQPRTFDEQHKVNDALRALSKKLDVPLVATNDLHYLNSEDADAHDVLLCIQTKRLKSETDRMSMMGDDYSLISGERMAELMPDDLEAIANTVAIAEQCSVDLELGKVQLPHFPVPEGKTADAYLRELCEQNIPRRYGAHPDATVTERLDYELGVIAKTGFASYFLIVQDFVNWAKSQGIVVGPGRGSGAGSIVAYLTNITNIDPIAYNLFFERFLNPERISMPDFDIDFADTRRDEVIRYVESRYGKDHVAQIITFGTMAARAAVRDVGRALGLPYAYCDRVAKLIPPMHVNLEQAMATIPELKDIVENDADGARLLETAKRLEGVARHASIHACGVVIAKDPLTDNVPLQFGPQNDEIVITQFSLHPVEDLGLLKMDFLGLSNLTILETAIRLVEELRGEKIDLDRLPMSDKKAFKLLQSAHTIGVFQLESSGMRRYLKELKPTTLEDIIAMVALYRPGPMELIPDYIAGKHGRKQPTYLHPKLKPILETTYGVAVYQEQLMQIARDLAGFTLGEADVLRKAVGKKIAKLLKEQREKFVAGCEANNISKSTAEKIFAFIEPFAGYGFNRSHAACYALVAYQTAYFKANYPAEFMAALLTSDHGNSDRVALEIEECRTRGIAVLPPDVNESTAQFTVVRQADDSEAIRFGLSAIKNLGDNVIAIIITERQKNGPYQTLEEFLRRAGSGAINRKSLESLIKSGALDRFGDRHELLENVEELLVYVRNVERETKNGQTNLFGLMPVQQLPTLKLHPALNPDKQERLRWEKELLGLYLSEHPLAEAADALRAVAIPCNELGVQPRSRPVTIGGVITNIKRVITKAGEPMMFVRLEDMTGAIEVLVFPSTLKETAAAWVEDRVVIVNGKLSDKDGELKLICATVKEFISPATTNNGEKHPVALVIGLGEGASSGVINQLKSILGSAPGAVPVSLSVSRDGEQKRVATAFRVAPTTELQAALGEVVGNDAVNVLY